MSAIDAIRRHVETYKPEYSKEEQELLKGMSPEERKLQELKFKLEKERELVNFISNVLKQMHESRMAIINNMR
jgi:hypothetical protein